MLFLLCLSVNVVRELETALSEVIEITGNLRIVRSVSLMSLGFFKRLVRIKNLPSEKSLTNDRRFGLYVMDNQNLQELFPNNVTIERGRLFFHFNPKLCYSTILRLKDDVAELRNVTDLAQEDVATNSNGDKIACRCRPGSCIRTDDSGLPNLVHNSATVQNLTRKFSLTLFPQATFEDWV